MTTLTLASNPFVSLQLSGHKLAYVNVVIPPQTPVYADPRARYHNEYVNLYRIEYDTRSPLENPHWLAYFRSDDGMDVRVELWSEAQALITSAGYYFDLDDMRTGESEPVWITVLLEWCTDDRLRVAEIPHRYGVAA